MSTQETVKAGTLINFEIPYDGYSASFRVLCDFNADEQKELFFKDHPERIKYGIAYSVDEFAEWLVDKNILEKTEEPVTIEFSD